MAVYDKIGDVLNQDYSIEEIEGFDKDGFVAEVVRDRLKELEEEHGKVVAWNIQPFYFEDEGLKEK